MGKTGEKGGAAIALRSTSTIVGMWFEGLGGLATGYDGTVAIAGTVRLDWVKMGSRGLGQNESLLSMQFAVASEVPGSAAELDGADQLFPHASTRVGEESRLFVGIGYFDGFFPVGLVVPMNGRRFVCGLRNGGSGTVDYGVSMGITAVIGGEARSVAHFLAGDWLEER